MLVKGAQGIRLLQLEGNNFGLVSIHKAHGVLRFCEKTQKYICFSILFLILRWHSFFKFFFIEDHFFLHAKIWIQGGEKSIFTAVIHQWRWLLCQFASATTIHEYDITMPVPYIHVMAQIKCGDVTILSQKRPSLATIGKQWGNIK